MLVALAARRGALPRLRLPGLGSMKNRPTIPTFDVCPLASVRHHVRPTDTPIVSRECPMTGQYEEATISRIRHLRVAAPAAPVAVNRTVPPRRASNATPPPPQHPPPPAPAQ